VSKEKDILKKTWNSLSQLKEYLEKNTKEKILAFDGITLETNSAYYTLAFGELTKVHK